MVVNAVDEVLFWSDAPKFIDKIRELDKKYYPQNFEMFRSEKEKFFAQEIPTKNDFIKRLEYYEKNGKPVWVGGRNNFCDDLSLSDAEKSIVESSTLKNGETLAKRYAPVYAANPDFWKFYTDNILCEEENSVLELTVGAGLGTCALMRVMSQKDLCMSVDIDFICAKHADALAKYHKVNALGISTSLWNMPFDDGTFSSVCSCNGIDECREVPAILEEAVRVLKPHGKMVLICRDKENNLSYSPFKKYGFDDNETSYWLNKVRLYDGARQIENLASNYGLSIIEKREEKSYYGTILVFEKLR